MRAEPSARELQVLAAYLRLGNKGAGEALGISIKTVKNHKWNLFRILDVDNSDQAAAVLGWLVLPE
jgi:DNA-binding CsgD family transcriptional regulator